MLHYWFVESEGNPTTDPVVLWLNGGPGASSLIGLLTENGPFVLNDDSIVNTTNVPQLIRNPYTWSKNANVLFLESPKGVGFSYCNNKNNCLNTDETTAADSYEFLVNFFKGFSEFANNEFFITGESYAGIYIPMLMDQIDKNGGINLKGAAIGDGCWGNEVGTCSFSGGDAQRISFTFYKGHAMIPQTLSAKIESACGNFTTLSTECKLLLSEMNNVMGDFDIYNVYDDCGGGSLNLEKMRSILASRIVSVPNTEASLLHHPQLYSGLGGALNDYVCGAMDAMNKWLNLPEVIKALHVETGKSGMNYRRTVADLRPLYKELVQKYRTVIYSGDVDACVPFVGSEEWTRELGFSVKDSWRPWKSGSFDRPTKSLRAGYVLTYTVPNQSFDFTFLTVSGAGHMVPQFKPVRALAMLDRFLKGEKF